MNHLTDPQYLKNLFQHYHIKPKHFFGQNFLIDEDVLAEIISTAQLSKQETVLEVGPGIGVLTLELAKNTKQVLAVEKDRNLMPILKRQIKDYENVEIINNDILQVNLQENLPLNYKVVANIPYYLTSNLLQHFLAQKNKPQLLVLMVQKEVGERIVAPAGELSILGLSVQLFADAQIAAAVSKNSFWPKPKVDSVILRIEPKNKFPEIENQKLFFRLAKIAFAGKRKQIHNTLENGLGMNKQSILEMLAESGIQPTTRPQDLSLQNWVKLYQAVAKRIQ